MVQFIIDLFSWVWTDPVTAKAVVKVGVNQGAASYNVGIMITWGK